MVHSLYLQNAKRNRNHARNELQLGFCRCELYLVVESADEREREQMRKEKMQEKETHSPLVKCIGKVMTTLNANVHIAFGKELSGSNLNSVMNFEHGRRRGERYSLTLFTLRTKGNIYCVRSGNCSPLTSVSFEYLIWEVGDAFNTEV